MNTVMKQSVWIGFVMTAISLFNTRVSAQSELMDSREQSRRQLISRFDRNGNGKIDVSERKEYVRAVARQKDAEAKRLAAMRPKLTPSERLFLKPVKWNPDKLRQYDANKNGTLEPEEMMKERQDAAEVAKAEFKKADRNGDGRLDAAERKAVPDKIQPRRPDGRAKKTAGNQ